LRVFITNLKKFGDTLKKDLISSNKREDTVEIRKAIEPNATRPQKVKYK